jgi:hypothetical protein
MKRGLKFIGHDPTTVIEFILALGMLVGGLYVLSPFVVINISLSTAPAAVQALASTIGLALLGGTSAAVGAANLYGIWKYNYKVRSAALFSQIMIRLYVFIATLFAQGFFPLTWLSSFILMCVATICYLTLRRKMNFFQGRVRRGS